MPFSFGFCMLIVRMVAVKRERLIAAAAAFVVIVKEFACGLCSFCLPDCCSTPAAAADLGPSFFLSVST